MNPVIPQIDPADTAWVLIASALVLAMIVPGLALFYGGLVRSKNVLGMTTDAALQLSHVENLELVSGRPHVDDGPRSGPVVARLPTRWLAGATSSSVLTGR